MTPDTLVALAERAKQKPPFFSACWWGFHRVVRLYHLITCGRVVCVKCGLVFDTSLFGDFDLSRDESAAALRAHAALSHPEANHDQ